MFEQTKQGAVNLIRCAAPLSRDNAEQVVLVLDKCLDHGQPRVVLNLQHVPLIDSKGLELLVDYQRQCIARGGCMKLAAPAALCRDILVATDVISHFEVFEDELAAAGSFAQ